MDGVVTGVEDLQSMLTVGPVLWTDREQAERERYRNVSRRSAWEAGRILAKRMLGRTGVVPAGGEEMEILSRDANGQHVRANVFIDGRRLPVPLSISHSSDTVAVAIGTDPLLAVGIDVVTVQPYSRSFLNSWFTEQERNWVGDDPQLAALVWGAKEAVYKAVSENESFSPCQIEFYRGEQDSDCCRYFGHDISQRCHVEVRQRGEHQLVVTVAVQRRPMNEESRTRGINPVVTT